MTELLADIDTCKSSVAGTGEAHALVNPFAPNRAELEFKVTPIVGNKEILFVLDSNIADAVLHGKIKGSKMTIEIPKFLQMPAPNTYSALLDLTHHAVEEEGLEGPDLLDRLQVEEAQGRRQGRLRR